MIRVGLLRLCPFFEHLEDTMTLFAIVLLTAMAVLASIIYLYLNGQPAWSRRSITKIKEVIKRLVN